MASSGRALSLLAAALLCSAAFGREISPAEAQQIGRRIWHNECNGTIAGLTSWNAGENFASLGIGHFIWYPPGARGPFEESFPAFLRFAREHGAHLPDFLREQTASPWHSRSEFESAKNSPAMNELRTLLAGTIDLQAQFLVHRLEQSREKVVQAAVAPSRVQRQFDRVSATAQGCYALVDYVNFKGEGILPTERYQGKGWGLLQVLENMPDSQENALAEFADSARSILQRRVELSPPQRRESRWLSGWLNRVETYRS